MNPCVSRVIVCSSLALLAGTATSLSSMAAGPNQHIPLMPEAIEASPVHADPARPEAGPSGSALHLRTGAVDLRAECRDLADHLGTICETDPRHIIQLDGAMRPAWRERLAAAGVRVGQYLPTNSFIVDLSGADADSVRDLEFIRWHGSFKSEWKVSGALPVEGEFNALVTLFEGERFEDFADAAAAVAPRALPMGGDVVGENTVVHTLLTREEARKLATLRSVQFIEPFGEVTMRSLDDAGGIIQSNNPNNEPLHANGLTGGGQLVAVMDGPVNINHCSFSDTNPVGPSHRKVLAYNTALASDSHGTHVASIVLGDAGNDDDTRGVAYDAKMIFDRVPSFNNQTDLYNHFTTHHGQGARIHTNSWGNDGTTSYSSWTRAIDSFTWDNEDDIVIFAVTNTSTLRAPENAKNVLAVGATLNFPNQDLHCTGGTGPTIDGRRKPELYAPGCGATLSFFDGLNAARHSSACGTVAEAGTSMAAPGIAGAAALTRQYFVEGFYPSGAANPSDSLTPTGALMRAVLINGGQDLMSEIGYPGSREGWGRLNADESLFFTGDQRGLLVRDFRRTDEEALNTGDEFVWEIDVTGADEQLRVTMAFTDAPAAVGTSSAPVNDISLEVTTPSGALLKGNNFASGQSSPGGALDAINSVEQVHVTAPELGVWTIRVVGTAVNTSEPQSFALAVTGQAGDVIVSPCLEDINNDNEVGPSDLSLLLSAFGSTPADGNWNEDANLNGDAEIGPSDLSILLSRFNQSCP